MSPTAPTQPARAPVPEPAERPPAVASVLESVEQPFRIPARLADFDELYARLAGGRQATAV